MLARTSSSTVQPRTRLPCRDQLRAKAVPKLPSPRMAMEVTEADAGRQPEADGMGRKAAPLETRRRAASDGPDFSGPPC